MPAMYLPKSRDMLIFAERLAAANHGRLSHNGFLRVAAPGRLVVARSLFQQCFPNLEGAVAAVRWSALMQRRSGHVARFSPEVIELVDEDSADVPMQFTVGRREQADLDAWAERLGIPVDEVLRAAVRAYVDSMLPYVAGRYEDQGMA